MHRIFVYGTLKKGFPNYDRFLKGLEGKRAKAIGFDLHEGPGFPYSVKGSGIVQGEVYEVDDATLERLDRLEGVPHHYQKISTTIYDEDFRSQEVWIYVSEQGRKYPIIESGVWK